VSWVCGRELLRRGVEGKLMGWLFGAVLRVRLGVEFVEAHVDGIAAETGHKRLLQMERAESHMRHRRL